LLAFPEPRFWPVSKRPTKQAELGAALVLA
jgi:hypothetical protein